MTSFVDSKRTPVGSGHARHGSKRFDGHEREPLVPTRTNEGEDKAEEGKGWAGSGARDSRSCGGEVKAVRERRLVRPDGWPPPQAGAISLGVPLAGTRRGGHSLF